jgi:hypothetical protein
MRIRRGCGRRVHLPSIAAVVAVVAGTSGLGIAGWGATPRASADAATEWSTSARADAMAIEYLNTNAPVFGAEPVIYGTPASAGSLVDSVGQSNAFAAAPYPGDIMVGAADNGNGALSAAGLPGIFSSYPFYVHSEYPIAQDKVQDQSGNRLVAHSDEHLSSSNARSGLITGDTLAALQAQASSLSSVDTATGTLTALADSRLDAFRLTDKLQIGRSIAHAKITRVGEGELKKESSFTIGSIVINGTEMSYGDGGFKFGDQKGQSPGDPKPLFDALKAAGITIEILPAKTTDTSIDSEGMKITQVFDYGAGKQRISFILGRVSAAVRGEAKPAGNSLLDTLPASNGNSVPDTTSAPAPPSAETTGPSSDSGAALSAPPVEPVIGDASTLTRSASAAPPDLALPVTSPSEAAAAPLPPVVAAVNPGAAGRLSQAAPPTVRLASPASVGRGLRNDDISGFYVGLGLLAALMTVAALVLRGGRRAARIATAGSVLRLPGT